METRRFVIRLTPAETGEIKGRKTLFVHKEHNDKMKQKILSVINEKQMENHLTHLGEPNSFDALYGTMTRKLADTISLIEGVISVSIDEEITLSL